MLKIYDGLFVFNAADTEEALEPLLSRVRSELVRLDGEVVSEDIQGRRAFARPIRKKDHGVYVRIRFQMEPGQIETLRKRYRLMDNLLRAQILSVDLVQEAALAEQAERRAAHAESVAEAERDG